MGIQPDGAPKEPRFRPKTEADSFIQIETLICFQPSFLRVRRVSPTSLGAWPTDFLCTDSQETEDQEDSRECTVVHIIYVRERIGGLPSCLCERVPFQWCRENHATKERNYDKAHARALLGRTPWTEKD